MTEPTQVCITVDTEFSIGGAFEAPDRYEPVGEPAVDCRIDGTDHGLGFLLRTFAEYGLSATFFVEALNRYFFGDAPMQGNAARIRAAGHDVQLHLHPCWLHFRRPDWRAGLADGPPGDSFVGRSLEDTVEILRLGIEAFERWGVPRPIAFRTGGFLTDLNVYRAMKRLEVPIGSNIGASTHDLGEPALALSGGRHWIEGVMELPVLTYIDRADPRALGHGRRRNLQVTACSWAEMKAVLWAARRRGRSPVVLLTHPFEFIKRADVQYRRMRRNRVNQARLVALCRFLREHEDDFAAVTFAQGKERWLAAGAAGADEMTGPVLPAVGRFVGNALNDLIWYY